MPNRKFFADPPIAPPRPEAVREQIRQLRAATISAHLTTADGLNTDLVVVNDRLLSDAADTIEQERARSPILDFVAWAEQRAKIRGPMTQDQYFLAEEAFFAAHPGEHLTSSTMTAHPPPTPEDR